jgi:hypothetical protein
MSTAPDNFQRLRDAGIIRTDKCPGEYRDVINNLEDTHVQAMLEVWERLQAVDDVQLEPGEHPRWTTCMWY